MEKVAENILGIYCGQNGFRLALILPSGTLEKEEHGKTSDLLSLRVLELLEKSGVTAHEISKIVVGIGPGSFTSSRVAVSFVKGICSGNKSIKIVPFTTFEYFSFGKKCNVVLVPAFSDFVFVENGNEQKCIEFKDSFAGNIVADSETFARWGKGKQIPPNKDFVKFIMEKSKEKSILVKNLRPVYLRASQAELAREEKKNGHKA